MPRKGEHGARPNLDLDGFIRRPRERMSLAKPWSDVAPDGTSKVH
jgi:hypothetical protein